MVGSAIAANEGFFETEIFILALATTLGLQVLSNFANDYGDFIKGTDNEDRVGPMRALQSGEITQNITSARAGFTGDIARAGGDGDLYAEPEGRRVTGRSPDRAPL